jgi:hypothetical protein
MRPEPETATQEDPMFTPLLRLLVTPLAIASAVMLMGLPDFTALDRAVSKAFASANGQAANAERPARAVLVAPRLPMDGMTTAPTFPPLRSAAPRAEQTGAEPRPSGRRAGDRVLAPLYASFVGLQALDIHSTLRAVDRGGREANVIMAPLTERPAAFIAFKAGSTAGILYLTERVRRRSPTAAIVMMAAFNSAYAMVVTNNYRIGNRLGAR